MAAESITHIVALDEQNKGHFENMRATFSLLRVTIHTTGAWPPPSLHSDNHVTLLLVLDRGGAIQVDMRTNPNDRRGYLVWKDIRYEHSHSEIKAFDYPLPAPVEVGVLYRAIRYEWFMHQYLFSAGGSGCHYWMFVLLYKMAQDPRFNVPSGVPAQAWERFGKWYSLSGAERPNNPIRQGEFQDYETWWIDWFAPDEDEAEFDT